MNEEFSKDSRINMIERQLRPNRVINETILKAFAKLPREQFLPKKQRHLAYSDDSLALGNKRAMLRPMDLGRMLEELRPQPDDFALVIGAGLGYSAALLGLIVDTVIALESDVKLIKQAEATLKELDCLNVIVQKGKMAEGYPQEGPYDIILIQGAIECEPVTLLNQLSANGRLIAIQHELHNQETDSHTKGRVVLWLMVNGILSHRTIFETSAPILSEFKAKNTFTL